MLYRYTYGVYKITDNSTHELVTENLRFNPVDYKERQVLEIQDAVISVFHKAS